MAEVRPGGVPAAQRVSVACSLDAGDAPDLERFVPMFHDWIRRAGVEGVLIDVARYPHVVRGPGVMLIGHDGDYLVEWVDGHRVRYTLKRDEATTVEEQVARALERLHRAAVEVAAGTGVEANETRIEITVIDRLRQEQDGYAATVFTAVEAVVGKFAGTSDIVAALTERDAREPLSWEFLVGSR